MDIKEKVVNRIRELRKELKLSQESLALEAEVDRTCVTDVEAGRRNSYCYKILLAGTTCPDYFGIAMETCVGKNMFYSFVWQVEE
jgi:DNA-binding XRE family transcriptional regulator